MRVVYCCDVREPWCLKEGEREKEGERKKTKENTLHSFRAMEGMARSFAASDREGQGEKELRCVCGEARERGRDTEERGRFLYLLRRREREG